MEAMVSSLPARALPLPAESSPLQLASQKYVKLVKTALRNDTNKQNRAVERIIKTITGRPVKKMGLAMPATCLAEKGGRA